MVIKLERDARRLACATHMAVANSGGEWAGTDAFPARSVGLENHHGNGLTLCVPQQGTDPPPKTAPMLLRDQGQVRRVYSAATSDSTTL